MRWICSRNTAFVYKVAKKTLNFSFKKVKYINTLNIANEKTIPYRISRYD